MDVAKAFIRLWHAVLIYKMEKQMYTAGMTRLLRSYFGRRQF